MEWKSLLFDLMQTVGCVDSIFCPGCSWGAGGGGETKGISGSVLLSADPKTMLLGSALVPVDPTAMMVMIVMEKESCMVSDVVRGKAKEGTGLRIGLGTLVWSR